MNLDYFFLLAELEMVWLELVKTSFFVFQESVEISSIRCWLYYYNQCFVLCPQSNLCKLQFHPFQAARCDFSGQKAGLWAVVSNLIFAQVVKQMFEIIIFIYLDVMNINSPIKL